MKKLVLGLLLTVSVVSFGFSKTAEPLPMRKWIDIKAPPISIFENKKIESKLLIRDNCTCGSGGSTSVGTAGECWKFCDKDRCTKFPEQCKKPD